jgi:hypothetical protein
MNESNLEEAFFSLYPNPSEEDVFIKLIETHKGSLKVEIINSRGDLVLEKEITNSSIQANIQITHGLPTGNYMLKISSDQRTAFKKLSVIK